MAGSHEHITPDRLCEAAEAVIGAAVEVAAETGGPWPYPADLMGGPLQPRCLAEFTRWEVEEACRFLVRMGALDAPGRKNAA